MKFYVAARFSRQEEMRSVRDKIVERGHEVTSNWLDEVTPEVKDAAFYEDTSRIDIVDIERADAMIFFAEDAYNQPPRGGRHVEFGYALGMGLPIFVIGEKENVFHYTPHPYGHIHHHDFLEDALDNVGGTRTGR